MPHLSNSLKRTCSEDQGARGPITPVHQPLTLVWTKLVPLLTFILKTFEILLASSACFKLLHNILRSSAYGL